MKTASLSIKICRISNFPANKMSYKVGVADSSITVSGGYRPPWPLVFSVVVMYSARLPIIRLGVQMSESP